MDPATLQVLLAAFAGYMIWKTASAPRRGTFLTLFGNIDRQAQPRLFRACLVTGYLLAAILLVAAMDPGTWLPMIVDA